MTMKDGNLWTNSGSIIICPAFRVSTRQLVANTLQWCFAPAQHTRSNALVVVGDTSISWCLCDTVEKQHAPLRTRFCEGLVVLLHLCLCCASVCEWKNLLFSLFSLLSFVLFLTLRKHCDLDFPQSFCVFLFVWLFRCVCVSSRFHSEASESKQMFNRWKTLFCVDNILLHWNDLFLPSSMNLLSFLLVSILREYWLIKNTNSYLVDPASSDMLVLKIKPCMCKYKWNSSETANGSLYQL